MATPRPTTGTTALVQWRFARDPSLARPAPLLLLADSAPPPPSPAAQAIYFGNAHWKGNTGFGDGPWVGADLEAGMYFGGGNATIVNNASKPLTSDFVSLHLKGKTDGFMLKGGDADVSWYKDGLPGAHVFGKAFLEKFTDSEWSEFFCNGQTPCMCDVM